MEGAKPKLMLLFEKAMPVSAPIITLLVTMVCLIPKEMPASKLSSLVRRIEIVKSVAIGDRKNTHLNAFPQGGKALTSYSLINPYPYKVRVFTSGVSEVDINGVGLHP
jgi:hypothetical protein